MITECPECGAKNQITQPPQPSKTYRCGKCGAVIPFLETLDSVSEMTSIPVTQETEELAATSKKSEKINWFQKHLNWTWVLAYLIWIPLNTSENGVVGLIAAVFLLVVSGWVIKQKGRRLWWILLTIVFSPLWLRNKKGKLASSQKLTMPLIQRAKTSTGYFVQIIGYLLWLGCGLYIMFYEIWVIYDAFGFWLAAIAFIFFPVVYALAFFIDWLITGIFPLSIFILWLLSWIGMAIIAAGGHIREEE